MIDFTKPLRAKIYDFNATCNEKEGIDESGEYIIRDIHTVIMPNTPYATLATILYHGGESKNFKILQQG
jgi:hypothetical protein